MQNGFLIYFLICSFECDERLDGLGGGMVHMAYPACESINIYFTVLSIPQI